MRKIIAFITLLAISSGLIFAQEIYIRAGSGYSLPVATSVIGENYRYTWINDGNIETINSSRESVSGSYGAGTNFNFAIGYKINENFILDLNIQYLKGRSYETISKSLEDNMGEITIADETHTRFSRGIFLNPGIIFSAGWGNMAPYAKIGIIAGSPIFTENGYYYSDDGVIDEDDITWEYLSGLTIGYHTSIGINWNINDKIDVFSEFNFVSMTVYVKEGRRTEHIRDGIDILDMWSVYQTQRIYKKEIDPTIPFDATRPQYLIRESRPFSSISGNIGVRFSIWKKKDISSDY